MLIESKILSKKDRKHWIRTYPSFTLNESKISQRLSEGRLIVLHTIRSTNQYVIDNLQHMKLGDVFVTNNQTHGKGRYGKIWLTPSARGLALSMYWRIYRKSLVTVELSLIISFVVAKVLKKLGVPQIKIKWPNDLYVYDRKLAGVLVEIVIKNNKVFHLVIGIGINISICACSKLEMNIDKNWIDLNSVGVFMNPNILIISLVKELRIAMKIFEYNRYVFFTTYYSQELDYLYNQPIALLFDNQINYGTVVGINPNGILLVLDQSGMIHRYLRDDISIYRL